MLLKQITWTDRYHWFYVDDIATLRQSNCVEIVISPSHHPSLYQHPDKQELIFLEFCLHLLIR